MIRLTRLGCPDVLLENGPGWSEIFLERFEAGHKRPDSRQYAHRDVVEALAAMSFQKCFYCEHKFDSDARSVDHHREVARHPELAFTWSNLYLSCMSCQRTLGEGTVPRADTLDPCDTDPDTLPSDHLEFHEEVIYSHTDRGVATIRKYKLDSVGHRCRRLKVMKAFLRLLGPVRNRAGSGGLTAEQRKMLWRFAHRSQPYSLMFRKMLEDNGVPAPN